MLVGVYMAGSTGVVAVGGELGGAAAFITTVGRGAGAALDAEQVGTTAGACLLANGVTCGDVPSRGRPAWLGVARARAIDRRGERKITA